MPWHLHGSGSFERIETDRQRRRGLRPDALGRLRQTRRSRTAGRPRIGISEDVSQPMNQLAYDRKVLTIDGVPLTEIAAEVGTPVYCYSSAILAARYRAYADAFAAAGLKRATVCYALQRSEERRVGEECVSRCSSRW